MRRKTFRAQDDSFKVVLETEGLSFKMSNYLEQMLKWIFRHARWLVNEQPLRDFIEEYEEN